MPKKNTAAMDDLVFKMKKQHAFDKAFSEAMEEALMKYAVALADARHMYEIATDEAREIHTKATKGEI